MTHHFTSLAASIEKVLEAEYFLGGVASGKGCELRYNLNAFLSACRSVTFVLQKSMSSIGGFRPWYKSHQARMRDDPAMSFFLELRNISQHEGPVSIVGGSTPHSPGWTYRFAGNRESVPAELVGQDVTGACADQLVKLARLLKDCMEVFPYEACPHAAISHEGMRGLGFSLDDVGRLIGLPPGFLDVGEEVPLVEKFRLLRREVDPIDSHALDRIAAGNFIHGGEALKIRRPIGRELTDDIAALIESGELAGADSRTVLLTAFGRRISGIQSREG